ncbi:MAG: B12-binding domain-containing protein [Methanomassiliicoccales archaeon]
MPDARVERMIELLLDSDGVSAREMVDLALEEMGELELAETIVSPALREVGRRWEEGTASLSQVYMSGRICEGMIDDLMGDSGTPRKGHPHMAIASLDDYHLLGMKVVRSVLRANGFNLLDYGRCTLEELLDRVREDEVEVLLVSTLMLNSALRVRELSDDLDASVLLVVGGAPFNFDAQLWKEVGADRMGGSAGEAVTLVREAIR